MTRHHVMRTFTATALAAATLGVLGSPAQAVVEECRGWLYGDNSAAATCNYGFGRYRVAAKCDSPRYPYSITIYGPWKWRESRTKDPARSTVNGDNYNCHIVRAWTSV